MKHITTYLLTGVLLLLACTGCKVHEWPGPYKPVQVRLKLLFDTAMPLYQEVPYTGRTSSSFEDYDVRYQVRAFLLDDNGNYNTEAPAYQFTFTKDDVLNLDHEETIAIAGGGSYRLIAWADYTDQGSTAHKFYHTDNFTTVTLLTDSEGNHVANNDMRDAFVGEVDIDVPVLETSTDHYIDATIQMHRPLAKFNFITTDLEEFAQYVVDLRNKLAAKEGRSASSRVDFDDFRIVFEYESWMPYVFDIHRNKPSRTYEPGQTFDSKITLLGGDEAELGFDYVFVNGTSSSVWIRLHAYDKDGTHITSVPNYVEVPITRSKLTTVRGAFLTASAGGGVGIDPDFDGEDYDYIVD